MDLSPDDAGDRQQTGGTAGEDRAIGRVVAGGPGSALVLRIGRQGRDRGEFVNPQGVCYSDADGGLVLVVDSNCACVQVDIEESITATPRSETPIGR